MPTLGIFIVEGILTIIIGLGGYWLLVDFPDSPRKSWRFLGDREKAWIVRRVNADRGDAATPKFDFKKFMAAGKDLKIWCVGLVPSVCVMQQRLVRGRDG